MAEGGKFERSTTGSEFVYDFYCEICKDDGKHLEAEGYCVDCDDYLCAVCFTHHRKARTSRHHELLDKESMPKDTPLSSDKVNKEISTKCLHHKREFVKYFCNSHESFGCSTCFTTGHRNCSDIRLISDLSEGILDGREYAELIKELHSLEQRSRDTVKRSHDNVSKAENQYSKAIKSMRQYREELNSILDVMEGNLKAKAEKLKSEDLEKLGTISEKCNSILKTIETCSSELRTLEASKKVCQMYITMKEAQTKVTSLKTSLTETENNNDVRMYSFEPNLKVKEFLNSPEVLGELTVQDIVKAHPSQTMTKDPMDIKATHIADIDVKSSSDTNEHYITGSAVLSKTRLVIADYNNNKVKLLDTQSNKRISELKVPSRPWDIAVISKYQVAVTLCSISKIPILRVTDTCTLTLEREITVEGECYGIAYSQGRLVVTYTNPSKLEIMDLRGKVIKRIVNDNNGSPLFQRPEYVCASRDNQTIYVSDYSTSKVIRLTFDGTVKSVYSDSELEGPQKVCVDHRGYVYVCGTNNVHMMTADCVKVKIILTQTDGLINNPRSVSHCEETDRLYIGMCTRSIVKVYTLSEI